MRVAPLLLLAFAACTPDTTPTFAADTVWLDPGDPVTGFLTWSVYGPGWERAHAERHFACAVVFELELLASQTERCGDCTQGFSVGEITLAETDCPTDVASALPVLSGVALGPIDPALDGADPWPGVRAGSYTAYDGGDMSPHGWAFHGHAPSGSEPEPVWDDEHDVTAWPAFAFDVVF